MSPEELLYYRERALIERQRAAESTNPYVIEIHQKLADLYDKLVEHEEIPTRRFQVVGGTGQVTA